MNNHLDSLYIKKVFSGDKNAFKYFINMYQEMAISIAISVVKYEADAKDVVQNAYVQAYKSLRSYKQKSKFSTWFYRIVVNESIKFLRKNKKIRSVNLSSESDSIQLSIANEADVQLDLIDKRKEIQKAMQLMKPKERLILELYYLQEYSTIEIGKITGFYSSNIKVLMHRARKSFSSLFKEIKLV
ncbi:MAG: RNA polymerase sigma factor (sigma-70 family) [Saprospiraceae bacterium]